MCGLAFRDRKNGPVPMIRTGPMDISVFFGAHGLPKICFCSRMPVGVAASPPFAVSLSVSDMASPILRMASAPCYWAWTW